VSERDAAERAADDGVELSIEESALAVHAALFSRDNVSDVWDGLDSLAEQASYIWFTREIDAQMQPGTVELPPKDPTRVSSTLRHGDPKDPTRGFAASSKRSSLKRASAKNGGNGGSKGGGKSGGSFGSSPGSKFGNGIGSSSALPPPTPSLRVVPAAQMGAYSKENGLLALNLLLFEVRAAMGTRTRSTSAHAAPAHTAPCAHGTMRTRHHAHTAPCPHAAPHTCRHHTHAARIHR
jgi:hypothetical protein